MTIEKRGVTAITQILILLIGIIAVAYSIGSEIKIVSSTNVPIPVGVNPEQLAKLKGQEITLHIKIGDTVKTIKGPLEVLKNGEFRIGTDKFTAEDIIKVEGGWVGYGIGFLGHVVQGFVWAGVVVGGVEMFANLFGIKEDTKKALQQAAFIGVLTERGLTGAAQQSTTKIFHIWGEEGWFGFKWSTWAAAGLGLAVFLAKYKKQETKIVKFECKPWEPPTGGSKCELCNKQKGGLPCSEYQCRALGQSCQLINKGTTEERCVWVNRNDVKPPVIQPLEDALISDDYRYTPDNAISPPDKGVKIIYNGEGSDDNGCVPAFTPLSFGVTLDEPAKCRIDYVRKQNFTDMDFWFGGSSLSRYNHTEVMSLPGPSALEAENITIQNGGQYELYVRCQDANGNANTANFVFKFCVQEGPDTTPPVVVATNLINGMPIAYNQSSIEFEMYLNEPAECKWSRVDQSFDNMENTMECSTSVMEMNAQMLYPCRTTLTGLKDRVENRFYFRCKDQPALKGTDKENDRNTNSESYKFTLLGTQPLVIDSVSPNGTTVRDASEIVKVTLEARTSAGYKDGEATCYYAEIPDDKNLEDIRDDEYIMFYNTGSHQHSQELFLTEKETAYRYAVKCVDLGGNTDTEIASFSVETDTQPPLIIRAYHEEAYLKLVTDEKAECVYDIHNCNYQFEDGTPMTSTDNGRSHFIDWNTKTAIYVKCKDEFENMPAPDECSIVVRTVEV